jgi:phenylalanyl-tRNA synthetase beta chain
VAAPDGCDRYVARIVTGFDPTAESPAWLQRRPGAGGMRPISLAVDITNSVMLEVGPAAARLRPGRAVRTGRRTPGAAGERLTTLDGQDRALDPEDLLITDGSGPIALAGVMGGGPTEITAGTTSILLESAHFAPLSIARTARRHRLPSEASRRYERGVDPLLAPAAAELAVRMLVELGGAEPGRSATTTGRAAPVLSLPLDAPGGWRAGRTRPRRCAGGWRTSAAPWRAPTRWRSCRPAGGPT